jgi:hypothetical protein
LSHRSGSQTRWSYKAYEAGGWSSPLASHQLPLDKGEWPPLGLKIQRKKRRWGYTPQSCAAIETAAECGCYGIPSSWESRCSTRISRVDSESFETFKYRYWFFFLKKKVLWCLRSKKSALMICFFLIYSNVAIALWLFNGVANLEYRWKGTGLLHAGEKGPKP